MLVHMNPVEVAGLRAAAQKMGGDLTTNPRTGQPEAFLPFLLGMGLQGLGMSALGAGIATGLGTAAITGDLGQGALAGLGAFGGAGMGEGLSAAGGVSGATAGTAGTAGAAGTAGTAGAAGATTGAESLLNTTGQGSFGVYSQPVGAVPTPTDIAMAPGAGFTPPPGGANAFNFGPDGLMPPGAGDIPVSQAFDSTSMLPVSQQPLGYGAQGIPGLDPSVTGTSLTPTGSSMTGLKNVLSTGDTGAAAREAFMKGVGGEMGMLKYGAAGLAPYAFEQPTLEGMEKQKSLIRPFDYDPYTREFTERTPYTAPGPEYMADGGIVERNQYNYDPSTQLFSKVETPAPQSQTSQLFSNLAQNPIGKIGLAMSGLMGFPLRNQPDQPDGGLGSQLSVISKLFGGNRNEQMPRYSYSYDPQTQLFSETPRMAQGGLTGYKEGNILRGQGDGMSDEIEASIGGEQDVLLSDGEYVIPADAVAMLGNGSTDAGANRLDEMIARLRMKKYGRDKQPPEMKAESVMPI